MAFKKKEMHLKERNIIFATFEMGSVTLYYSVSCLLLIGDAYVNQCYKAFLSMFAEYNEALRNFLNNR